MIESMPPLIRRPDGAPRLSDMLSTMPVVPGADEPVSSEMCTCSHPRSEHSQSGRTCFDRDSYDQPCTCWEFERDASLDPEEP